MARATTSTTGTTSSRSSAASRPAFVRRLGPRPGLFPLPQREREATRTGFTLWELLLSLCILLAVAAITWPAVYRIYDDYRLKQTTQKVWTEIVATRMQAIETGSTWQFRYEVGGGKWIALPQDGASAMLEMTSSDTESAEAVRAEMRSGELPEGITFAPASDGEVTVEQLSRDALLGLADPEMLASADWSTPVVFFVDGTSADDSLRVVDAKGRSMLLTVRGFTGEVEVGPVVREAVQ